MNRINPLGIFVVLFAVVWPASAVLLTFDDGDPGNHKLSSAYNWNPNQVPTSADDLVIPAGFAATGNLGGGTGTQANSVLIQGTVSDGNWALVRMVIDGGSITLGGGGAAFSTGTANLINNGSMTFNAKTAAEVVSQYAGNISVDGAAAVFGADPLVKPNF